jgi:hypothetical protein
MEMTAKEDGAIAAPLPSTCALPALGASTHA